MKKQHRNHSPSFKKKAVELSYARGNTKQVCEELDIQYFTVDEKNQKILLGSVISKNTEKQDFILFKK
ncbi:transposase [Flavisericum labens]|uniref:transposase n=1 Tax=Flavisericum labens TaxID=3377112 RepID=UPI00387B96BC